MNFWKKYKGLIILSLIGILVFIIVLILLYPDTEKIIQSEPIVILVFVTWFYAIQTKILAEQGRKQLFETKDQIAQIKEQTEQIKDLAIRSKELVEQQRLARDLEFNERRIHGFYNPFIKSLDLVIKSFGNIKIEEMLKLLDKPHEELYFRYSYMLSKKTYEYVRDLLIDFGTKAMDENNREIQDEDKKKLMRKLLDIRRMLHGERTKIEEYISENYPFPEKD